MSIALNLLADVRWRGRPVAGDRPRALLAALAARGRRPVPAEELIELVWGDEAPLNGVKSLQVLVSRVRTACGAESIVTDGVGYRLGAGPAEVDSERLAALARDAAAALDRDASAAAALAREAMELAAGLPGVGDEDAGPLAEVRRAAAADAAGRPGDPGARVQPDRGARGRPARSRAARTRTGHRTSRCSPTCCAARPPFAARRRRSTDSRGTSGTCASGSAPTPVSCSSGPTAACSRLTGRFVAACGTTRPR